MSKKRTWETKCRSCECPVYYTPSSLLLESKTIKSPPQDTSRRLVDCECEGETEKGAHTLSYKFPDDFKEI